jgi:hypothetical protein
MPVIRSIERLADVPSADWDRLANPAPDRQNPFVAHAFLESLEASGSVGPRTGWLPRHLILEDGARIVGAMPLYLKSHSQGEYVFDHGWAEAYQRAGGSYYPKLQAAVPFTPVPGPRILVGDGSGADATRELALARGAVEVASRLGVSSLHVTFLDEAAAVRISSAGYMLRSGRQFHWFNRGYRTFEDFLASLASRKRKTVRKERLEALGHGIAIQHVQGAEITEAHWDAFFDFYMDTGGRKWGRPYLNRRFFSELGQRMADRCLLVMARRDGRYIAGALNLIGGDCLYGRYWGAIEHHPCLHFEVCYYQAIEWAIANGVPRVEAGAQGDHKLARGYEPVATFSSHWIADAGFARAVGRFLAEERAHIEEERQMLAEFLPFRKAVAAEDA